VKTRINWHGGAYPTRAWLSDALTAAGFARHEFIYTPSFRGVKSSRPSSPAGRSGGG